MSRRLDALKDERGEVPVEFKDAAVEYRRAYGEKLAKNAVFYPALLRAGVHGTSLESELGLADEEDT